MMLLVLFVLLCCSTSDGATIQYNYNYGSTSTLSWSSPSTWVGGVVPSASDDVQIIGGSNNNYIQTLDLGTASISIHGLYVSAFDVNIRLGGILTVSNYSHDQYAFWKGSATGATFIVNQQGSVVATTGSYDSIVLNVSSSANFLYQGVCKFPHTTVNNMGNWKFFGDGQLDAGGVLTSSQTFVFNNYKNIEFAFDYSSYYTNANLNFIGALNSFIGGFISVNPRVIVSLGQTESSAVSTFFVNRGSFALQGELRTTDSARVNFTSSTTFGSGMNGTFTLLSYTNTAIVRFDVDLDLSNGVINFDGGPGSIEGSGAISVGSLILQVGGIIQGSGPFNVYNFTTTALGDGSGGETQILGRNLTVSGTWNQLIDLHFGEGAFIICTSTCNAIMDQGEFYQVDGDRSSVGLVNYGTIISDFSAGIWTCNVPIYNYGAITVPDLDGGDFRPTQLLLETGVQMGIITTYNDTEEGNFNSVSDEGANIQIGGPTIIAPTASFYGGMIMFYTSGADINFQNPALYVESCIHWQTRTQPIGDGVIMAEEGIRFVMDGSGVVIPRFLIVGGSIEGINNLTANVVKRAAFATTNVWQMNNTALIIDGGNLTMEATDIHFVGSGKVIINPNSEFHILSDLYLFGADVSNPDAGVYNYGSTIIDVGNQQTALLSANGIHFFNYGGISLNTSVTASGAKGAILKFVIDMVMRGASQINLNVYSPTDYDQLQIFPTSGVCNFSGAINFIFHYSPAAGDMFQVISTQGIVPYGPDNPFSCGGIFTVKTTGNTLPSGTSAILIYDLPAGGTNANVFHDLYICSSSNTTCTNYVRPPAYVHSSTTTTTTTTSNSVTGTTTANSNSGAGTSNSNGGSTTSTGRSTISSTGGNTSSAVTIMQTSANSALWSMSVAVVVLLAIANLVV